jgi:hypothetical protein
MRTYIALLGVGTSAAFAQQLERDAPSWHPETVAKTRAAADSGDPASVYLMARHFSTGECMPGDGERATALYWQAAEKRYPPAFYSLGIISAGSRDFESAELLFFRGAQLGHRGSELQLGILYMLAPAPIRNDEKAFAWLTVLKNRAEPVSSEAEEFLKTVSDRMSAPSLERAQRLAMSLSRQFGSTPAFVSPR